MVIRFILLFIVLTCVIEFTLRVVGFGDPVIYKIDYWNFYPKSNQNLKRFKGNSVKINHLGMRTDFDWKENLDLNKIIFFGDSVTFAGSYIDNNNLFSEKICKLYIKNSICGNYGVNGYMLQNLFARIKDIKKSKVEFDSLVILVSNSFHYGFTDFTTLPLYENFNYKYLKATTEIFNHILFKYKIFDRYHKIKKENFTNSFNKNLDKNIQLKMFKKLIKDISKDKKVFIFILPTLENLNGKVSYKHFLDTLNNDNFKIFNLYSKLKSINYELLYFNNAHLNKKGHDYLAKIIYEYIK